MPDFSEIFGSMARILKLVSRSGYLGDAEMHLG